MLKPVIGILCARSERPGRLGAVSTVFLNDAYRRAVSDAGGLPLLIPVGEDADEAAALTRLCSGLLIPGGDDVDPALYGQQPHPLLGAVDGMADRAALAAVHAARQAGLPILGICRGMQLVNVAFGGSLFQDLSLSGREPVQHLQQAPRTDASHTIVTVPRSVMAQLFGERVRVNSMHHQCVDLPGEGLFVTARTDDGLPEAMENADGSVLLVQWHPEELRKTVPAMNGLFAQLTQPRHQIPSI